MSTSVGDSLCLKVRTETHFWQGNSSSMLVLSHCACKAGFCTSLTSIAVIKTMTKGPGEGRSYLASVSQAGSISGGTREGEERRSRQELKQKP